MTVAPFRLAERIVRSQRFGKLEALADGIRKRGCCETSALPAFPSGGQLVDFGGRERCHQVEKIGWEAGIRTPIGGFRVRSPTVRRPPNKEIQFTWSAAGLSNVILSFSSFKL